MENNESRRPAILIVDDVPANIEVLAGILESDYEVLFATSGQDALEIAGGETPDLILLDIMMPGMDGHQVCQELKVREKTRSIPVIFVTAGNQEEDESRGLAEGVVDYMTKPVRPSVVKARVRNQLDLKRRQDELENLSTIDGLTGVYNRRRFDEAVETEWRRARRNQGLLSLIMMDIDFFKAYNDYYGHLAGDECLKTVAQGLRGTCRRPADLFARYGGEEFALLLPETDARGAEAQARLAQARVRDLAVPHAVSPAAEYVTLSMGVATTVPNGEHTQFDLIMAADQMLYSAKRSGRNRIEVQGALVSVRAA